MTSDDIPTPRGRPRKVTRKAIAEAGRKLTLPQATVAAIAEELGVGVRTLYKHSEGILDIQRITAEAIFTDWQAPDTTGTLAEHLFAVALSLRELAVENPGIAGFLLTNSLAVSPEVVQQIDAHHQRVSEAYDLEPGQASLLLAAVTEHTLAVTDVTNPSRMPERDYEKMRAREDLPSLSEAARKYPFTGKDGFFRYTTSALIAGLLAAYHRENDSDEHPHPPFSARP